MVKLSKCFIIFYVMQKILGGLYVIHLRFFFTKLGTPTLRLILRSDYFEGKVLHSKAKYQIITMLSSNC